MYWKYIIYLIFFVLAIFPLLGEFFRPKGKRSKTKVGIFLLIIAFGLFSIVMDFFHDREMSKKETRNEAADSWHQRTENSQGVVNSKRYNLKPFNIKLGLECLIYSDRVVAFSYDKPILIFWGPRHSINNEWLAQTHTAIESKTKEFQAGNGQFPADNGMNIKFLSFWRKALPTPSGGNMDMLATSGSNGYQCSVMILEPGIKERFQTYEWALINPWPHNIDLRCSITRTKEGAKLLSGSKEFRERYEEHKREILEKPKCKQGYCIDKIRTYVDVVNKTISLNALGITIRNSKKATNRLLKEGIITGEQASEVIDLNTHYMMLMLPMIMQPEVKNK